MVTGMWWVLRVPALSVIGPPVSSLLDVRASGPSAGFCGLLKVFMVPMDETKLFSEVLPSRLGPSTQWLCLEEGCVGRPIPR